MLDPNHRVKLQDPNSVRLSDLVVYNVDYNFGNRWILSSLHPEMLAAHRAAIEKLRAGGATIKELDIPELREGLEAFSVWSAMLFREKSGWFDDCIREGMSRMIYPLEFLLSIFDLSVHTLPSMLFAMSQRLDSFTPKRVEDYCALGEVLKKKLHAALASEEVGGRTVHKVLLTPALSCMAPTHGESLIRAFDVSNICIFNTMELPATAVPSGTLSSGGLPIGLQFVGDHGMDFVTIGAALRLEELGAKWAPPRPSATRLKYE
jgi:Asp-tRNA(Asn)/Glu-tRNA(Gln) amidotransferase A subunit family amidase